MNRIPTFGHRHSARETTDTGCNAVLARSLDSPRHPQIERERWATKLTLIICWILASFTPALAGYVIKTSQSALSAGQTRYTWTVLNEGETRGLDMFALEVPAELRVLAYTVPPPYTNPSGTAYWIMEQRQDPLKDSHDSRVLIPAPQPGKKRLKWCGMQSPSVYPPGTTATFSITTDSLVKSGNVHGYAVAYTPRNKPHYYLTWPEEIIGPSAVLDNAAASNSSTTDLKKQVAGVLAGPIVNPLNGHSYYVLPQSTWTEAVRLGGHLATIRNAAEDHWVYSTFGAYGALWIGLRDKDRVLKYQWASDEPLTYTNWSGGQPDNRTGGKEYYVHIWPSAHSNPGQWNDYAESDTVLGFPLFGVAEITSQSSVKLALSPSADFAEAVALSSSTNLTIGPELHAFTAIELSWATEAAKKYRLQWTQSLDAPQWVNLEPPITGTGTNVSLFDSTREHSQGFYRVRVFP